jgi:hypothetical protein
MALEQEQRLDSVDYTSSHSAIALEGVDTENLPKLPPATQPETQWQKTNRIISEFLDQLPDYLNRFWVAYKLPLITLVAVLAVVVTLRVVATLLDAINDVPLLEPTFDLIGMIYFTWFAFRHLLLASTRQELWTNIRSWRMQLLGEGS